MRVKGFLLNFFLLVAVLSTAAAAQKDHRSAVKDIRYSISPGYTRVVIELPGIREFTFGSDKDKGGIYVDILQAKVDLKPARTKVALNSGCVRGFSVTQKTQSTVRLLLDVDLASVKGYRVFHLKDPFRIIVDVSIKGGPGEVPGTTSPPAPAPGTSPAAAQPPEGSLPATQSLARQLGLGVRTIVLDAGHGGSQPGCIGKSGIMEKDLTLALTLALRKKLADAGYQVLLTRDTDRTVSLPDRTAFANKNKADLCVSIHVNASLDRKREGIETFYLNFTPDRTVIETAARENSSIEAGIGRTPELIKKIAQNDKVLESKDLAEKIQRNLVQYLSDKRHQVKSHGVKGGPFWVLIGGEMPSVLVEVAHLSNEKEEKLLQAESYRALIVEGLYNGIIEYIKSLNKG